MTRPKKLFLFTQVLKKPFYSINFNPSGLSDGVLPYPWFASTFAIADGKVINTPTLGTEIVTNGSMESDSNWANYGTPITNERSSEQAFAGTYSRKVVSDAVLEGIKSNAQASGTYKWYHAVSYIYDAVGHSHDLYIRNGANTGWIGGGTTALVRKVIPAAAWTEHAYSYLELAGGVAGYVIPCVVGVGELTFYYDDISIKPISNPDLFAVLPDTLSDVIVKATAVIVKNSPAGVVANLDSITDPGNFVLAYHDGTNARLVKAVRSAANQIANGAFDDTSAWLGQNAQWVIADGKATHNGPGNSLYQSGVLTANKAYKVTFIISSMTTSTCSVWVGNTTLATISANGDYSLTGICTTNTLFGFTAASGWDGSIDNVVVTLADPTYTELINTSATYVSGAWVEVRKSGTTYKLYYNNAKVGSNQTISDAAIIYNRKHGMFSTGGGSQLTSFFVVKN